MAVVGGENGNILDAILNKESIEAGTELPGDLVWVKGKSCYQLRKIT